MADEGQGDNPRGRRLPPVSRESEGPENEARPKRKRRPRSTDNTDGQEGTERPRRRSRRPRSEAPSEPSAVPEEGEPTGSRTELIPEGGDVGEPSRPRKKRRKKRRPAPEGDEGPGEEEVSGARSFDHEYGDLAEDIVSDDNAGPAPDSEAGGDQPGDHSERRADEEESRVRFHRAEPTLRSQPLDRMFIEGKTRFRSEDKLKYEQRLQAEKEVVPERIDEGPQNLTLEFALSVSRVFRGFSMLLHGPFAGMAIMHCLFVWQFAQVSVPTLLQNYAKLSRGSSIAYYCLFVVCTVSACVRSDIGRPSRKSCAKCWTLQSGAIAVLFYFIGFIVSNYMYKTEFQFHLHTTNATYWMSLSNQNALVTEWKALDIVRCVCICLGWVAIAFTPIDDRLRDNLRAGIEEFLADGDEELVEVRSTKA